jgi:hypothetical protein
MRTIFLAAGAAIAFMAAPALAQGHGHGGGVGGGIGGGIGGGMSGGVRGGVVMPPMSTHANDRASGPVQTTIHAQTDTHASMRAHARTGASVEHGSTMVPRGQTVRPFRVGQRLPTNYKWYSDLGSLSASQRSSITTQYPTANYRYLYSGGNVYVVTRNNNTVRTVIDVTP